MAHDTDAYAYHGYMVREADTAPDEIRLWYATPLDRDEELYGPCESPADVETWIDEKQTE